MTAGYSYGSSRARPWHGTQVTEPDSMHVLSVVTAGASALHCKAGRPHYPSSDPLAMALAPPVHSESA